MMLKVVFAALAAFALIACGDADPADPAEPASVAPAGSSPAEAPQTGTSKDCPERADPATTTKPASTFEVCEGYWRCTSPQSGGSGNFWMRRIGETCAFGTAFSLHSDGSALWSPYDVKGSWTGDAFYFNVTWHYSSSPEGASSCERMPDQPSK